MVKIKFCWFRFRNLPVTMHFIHKDFLLSWQGIYGISIGDLFLGCVRGKHVKTVLKDTTNDR